MNHGSGSSQRRADALLLAGEYGSGLTCEGCHTTEERDDLTGSFDDLVGAGEQGLWHFDAKRLGCFEVDYQLEFGRLLHR